MHQLWNGIAQNYMDQFWWHLSDTASKFALFSVSSLKNETLIKKQTYMKTKTCKLYSRVFWIFLPNIIIIDLYNFELYCFKVGAFFQCICDNISPASTLCKIEGKYYRSDSSIVRCCRATHFFIICYLIDVTMTLSIVCEILNFFLFECTLTSIKTPSYRTL